jgi:hypothetical protein
MEPPLTYITLSAADLAHFSGVEPTIRYMNGSFPLDKRDEEILLIPNPMWIDGVDGHLMATSQR